MVGLLEKDAMSTTPDNGQSDAWATLEPYAQLVRALLPRATGLSVFDPRGSLRWSSADSVGAELGDAVLASLQDAVIERDSPGQMRLIDGDLPAYLCWLREDDTQQLVALIAIQVRAASDGEQRPFSFIHSLIRPALECLRRELTARVNLEALSESLTARDRDLDLVLAVSARDGSTDDDASALRKILDNTVSHLDCALAALLVPEKSLVLFRMASERPAEGQLLARTHRHLLSIAQIRREPLIMNRVAQNSAFGALPYKILACAVRNPQGRAVGVLALYRHSDVADFTDREARLVDVLARKSAMIVEASYDGMTGLLNRPAFEQRARAMCGAPAGQPAKAGAAPAKSFTTLYIDVDQLHLVNDNFGMHVGDLVLSMLGDLMRRRLPPGAVAARISGDRFAVILQGGLDAATGVAETLREGAEQLTAVQGDERSRVSLSIGVASLETANGEFAHALAEAETACKAAKDRGRNRVETFELADQSVVRRFTDITIAATLRAAIAEDRLRLDAQLILPLATRGGHRPHFELLLRMIDDAGETVGPDRFLSAAHRYQIMPMIDRWVMDNAVQMLRPHADLLSGAPICFAINLSGQSLNDLEFVDEVIQKVQSSGIDPEVFCFELTETAAIANLARAEILMRRLRKLGCSVALDDFGTGLSSLAYLRQLPVSILKIDGSFVRDIVRDPRAESLVQAVAQLARSMDIATVAEYVETDEIRERVAALGVDYGQGFAIGRPTPLTEILKDLPVFVAASPVRSDGQEPIALRLGSLH